MIYFDYGQLLLNLVVEASLTAYPYCDEFFFFFLYINVLLCWIWVYRDMQINILVRNQPNNFPYNV